MSLITIKQYIETNLPSNNQIAINILVAVLKAMADDFYTEGGSDENFTTILLNKLNGIEDGAQVNPISHEIAFINGLQAALDNMVIYTNDAINGLVDGAPGTLNTLNELALAINNDPNFYTNIVSLINTKGNISSKELFTATAAQTVFTLSSIPGTLDVWVDRVYQIESIDYTILDNIVTMTEGVDLNSIVVIRKY